MANPLSMSRTAPIPISLKHATSESLIEHSGSSADDSDGASVSSPTSAESSLNSRSRRHSLCYACRRRKVRCVLRDGLKACVACRVHGQECSFLQSRQLRKRKLNGDAREESFSKRRYLFHHANAHLGLIRV